MPPSIHPPDLNLAHRMTVLETERLALRRFTPDDAEFVLRLLNEPSFIENIGDKGVRTVEQAAGYLTDGPIHSYDRHGHGLYLVEQTATGQPIGMCGLIKREQLADVDLGYAYVPEAWSRGYAFEAAAAVLRYGRDELGFTKTLAIVSPGNAGSIRLLEKLGFSFVELMQVAPGGEDTALYERVDPAAAL
ncbi:MAG: ribosomal-protein-alanine acetyltransferase [Gemmatimonadetes bacterium]|nr:ribosomal-protein-alanine acetyltransferase [Gemmatimonadota bacterium]